MKLAIVTHNVMRGDGQSRVSFELAHHALQQGEKVWLLADHVEKELLNQGATWIPVQPRWRQTHLTKVWQFARLSSRVLEQRASQFDVIQAFGFVLNRAHTANNSQFVHHSWRRSPVHTARLRRDAYGAYQWLYSYLNTLWEQQAYRKAQVVIASSQLIRWQLIESGVPAERIRVILNGVDLDEFHPGPAERAALGLPENVPLALFAGDIRTPRKNLDTILRALAQVPDVHLAVVGAVQRSPYPKLAQHLGLSSRVHFMDFRRDVAQIMRAVDLFVFPSRYEACSLVLLEAIASGLPVITAETAGGAEIITSHYGIVLPKPDDVQALAAAIRSLLNDSQRLDTMRQAARRAAEKHSWERMAQAYFQLYSEVEGK